MSTRQINFVKLWKEHVFDVAYEKSLDLYNDYMISNSTNISEETTGQEKLENTKDDKDKSLHETFLPSNDDNNMTDPFLDEGKGKKALALANNDIVQDKSEREGEIELNNVAVKDESDKIEHIENEGTTSVASENTNIVQDESVDVVKIKSKNKIPKSRCQRVKTNVANFGMGWCMCTTITSCLCFGLCMVPLFFLGRCLCCNCPSCGFNHADNDKKSAKSEKTKGDVKPSVNVEGVEKEKKSKVITKAPSAYLKPILEEVASEINAKREEKISEKPNNVCQ